MSPRQRGLEVTASVALWEGNLRFPVSLYKQTPRNPDACDRNLSLFQMGARLNFILICIGRVALNIAQFVWSFVIACEVEFGGDLKRKVISIQAEHRGRGIKLIPIDFTSRWLFVSFERWVESWANSTNWNGAVCAHRMDCRLAV